MTRVRSILNGEQVQAAADAALSLWSESQQRDGLPERSGFSVLAVIGLALLIAVAVVPARHDLEIALTACGALLLASAQIWRRRNHAGR